VVPTVTKLSLFVNQGDSKNPAIHETELSLSGEMISARLHLRHIASATAPHLVTPC
jgi:hypothetical protein